jgi:hypothetical protein
LSLEELGFSSGVTVSGELEESRNGLEIIVLSSTSVPETAVRGALGTVMVEAVGS